MDDYHAVDSASLLHEIVTIGLSAVTQGIRIIVLSRGKPPPAFIRMRANDTMSVLEWDDLRFTPQESRLVLRAKGRPKLNAQIIDEIQKKTEGWAAGLVLLAQKSSLREGKPLTQGDLVSQEVFDYFAGEVLGKLDGGIRDFLLMSSFLPRMTARTAEKMTGQGSAGRILSELNHNHFFIEKNQAQEPSYKYNSLFHEFLQTRAKESLNPEGIRHAQNRAAAIVEETGNVEDAISLYRAAQNWERYVPLILGQAQALIRQGRSATLSEWLAEVPPETTETVPWLQYWSGICCMAFHPRESRLWLEKAFARFETIMDRAGVFLAWSGIVATFIYEWGDFAPLDHWIAGLDEMLDEDPSFPSPEIEAQVAVGMLSAMTNRQPWHADLPQWAERVQRIAFSSDSVPLRMLMGNQLMLYYLWVGDFSQAAVVIDASRPAMGCKEYDPLTRQNWYVMEAMYSWFAADWKTCKRAIDNGIKNAADSGIHLLDLYLMAQGVFGGLSLGDPSMAESCLDRMLTINSPRPGDMSLYQYQASAVAWHNGDYKKSAAHGKQAVKIAREIGWPIAHVLCLIELAITLSDDGRADEADACFAKATEISRGMIGLRFVVSLNGARFAFSRAREEQGLVLLERGLALGARYGFINMPRWNDVNMSRLCAKALEHGIEPEYACKLIEQRGLVPERPVENWPYSVKIYTLGCFELAKNGELVRCRGKVQQKPLALLKALIAFGGKNVSENQITDALWPDTDGDLAHRSFEMAVHRLRKLIGNDKVILLQERRLSINASLCWVDAQAFEYLLNDTVFPATVSEAQASMDKAIHIYKGHFLSGDSCEPWALSYRERLRSKFSRLIIKQGTYLEEAKQWGVALEVFRKGIDVDDRNEEFYQHLMVCHQRLGQRVEAISVYNRCCVILSSTLGISPSRRTTELYRAIKNEQL